jgi:hypothetical protein
MGGGPVDSGEYFPEQPQHKKMARTGEIKGFKYPDTEEMASSDQGQFVKETSKNLPKSGFRH